MRYEDDRRAEFALNAPDLVLQRSAHDRIDRAERFVHQEYARLGGQRPRDAGALLFAARELARVAIAVRRRLEVHERKQFVNAAGDARAIPAEQRGHHTDVGADREVRKKTDGLDHVADTAAQHHRIERAHIDAVDEHRAARRFDQPVDRTQERALAGARRPEEHGELAAGNREIDVAYGNGSAGVRDADPAQFDVRALTGC